jgi:AcrR family transcriptional regulator
VPVTAARPLRRDAERNRRRILDAARELMAERGVGVSLEEVAAAAEVGVGTVYRRFPDRESLVRALFAEHVDAVVALAAQARGSCDPWQGIQDFLGTVLAMQAADRGLSQILRGGDFGATLAREARIRITPAVDELITLARNAGQLPADVGPGDLVLAELMVGAVAERAGPDNEATWRRALSIVLAGLRTDGLVGTTPDGTTIDRLQGR